MAFSFSSRDTMIGYLTLRLETYPQDRGTRPLAGQAGKGLGALWYSLGPMSRQGLRRVASLPSPNVHPQPEQREEQELREKRVAYHLIPFPWRSNGGMLPVFRANELSVGWRYTTPRKQYTGKPQRAQLTRKAPDRRGDSGSTASAHSPADRETDRGPAA